MRRSSAKASLGPSQRRFDDGAFAVDARLVLRVGVREFIQMRQLVARLRCLLTLMLCLRTHESLLSLRIPCAGQIGLRARPGFPAGVFAAGVLDQDAIHRTDGQAQLAPRAIRLDHGVHALVCAHDGIGRAGLDAQGATNAPVLVDPDHRARGFYAVVCVEWQGRLTRQRRQALDASLTPGWTLVDAGFALDDRTGVAGAIRVATTRALRLWQGIEQVLLETQAGIRLVASLTQVRRVVRGLEAADVLRAALPRWALAALRVMDGVEALTAGRAFLTAAAVVPRRFAPLGAAIAP